MKTVGIIGASGYAGAELLRLCAGHPGLKVAWATGDRQAGAPIADLYPNLRAVVGDQRFEAFSPAMVDGLDAVFLCLPHGASGELMPEVRDRVALVVDLAADFRLQDAAAYPIWYGEAHPHPELLAGFAYGLPELFRDDLVGATGIAAPGCYPTAAALALAPLLRAGAVVPSGIVVDAASGVSGAGRDKHPFCGTDENFAAYGLLDHRHTPEIEQVLGAQVLFTPHLAPMNRGILATCYARPTVETTTADLLGVLHDAYDAEPFVVVVDEPPSTKATQGSNVCHVTVRADPRTGWVLAVAALDNLVKGAAGQAPQGANLALGLDEGAGLPLAGLLP
ncbi:MAG: N-acetyl-gamma-glutamyl-phosphate reductase [Acidimicrobiia bacterium]